MSPPVESSDLIGTRLGHFEILGSLGKGGMGEVYRARDSRLGREVAIKVLPVEVSGDAERLRRFRREAELLARLSHPNAATIHEIGEHDGRPFLVMELVPGETLADRIARAPIALVDAVGIALKIARALEAAYARRIVHRDLKPGNVMVLESGEVKVLDFGLAKALAPEEDTGTARETMDSPTLTAGQTRAGEVLGTVSYMSPEQARGRPVDARTDLWAFGCMVFEMVSGRRPFVGATTAETIAAVLHQEPDWSVLPGEIPQPVRRLLRRCLVKDPDGRLHHPADARLELAAALEGEEGIPLSVGSAAKRWWVAPLSLIVGATLGALAMLWAGQGSSEREGGTTTRFQVDILGAGQLDNTGRSDPLAVSSDGRTLAYVARAPDQPFRLHVRRLDELETRVLAGTDGASNPFFSHDGRWIAYFASGRLKKISVAGGAPVDVATVPLDNLGGTWSHQGVIAFCSYAGGLWTVPESGGEPELVARAADLDSAQVRWPQFLPDGDRVLLILQRREGSRLALVDVDSGRWSLVPGLQAVAKARYLPGGVLVVAQQGEVLGARFDPEEGRLTGAAVSLVTGVSMLSFGGSAVFEVSPSGTLIYAPGDQLEERLTWVDREGVEEPLSEHLASFTHPVLSPDDSRLAVEIGTELGDRQIQIHDLKRGTRSIVASAGRNAQPKWHPGGHEIAVASDRGGDWDLYALSPEGAVRPLLIAPLEQWLGTWSRDGMKLVFYQVDPETSRDLWVLDLEADNTATPFRETAANERGIALSPNDRWLAYVSDESGRDEVYVESFPQGGSRWTVSTGGGREPVWSHDGSELFYREEQRMMAVSVRESDAGLELGAPILLFEGDYAPEIVGNPNYDVAADGRFVMIRSAQLSSTRLNVVLDWDREIHRALGVRP
jgi:eukaryotic-like serine/threonine-protein kinase